MPESRAPRWLRLPLREIPLAIVLVGLFVWFSLASTFFLDTANLLNVGRAFYTELAFLTIASGLVLLTRGIDLSVAATLSLSSVIVGVLVVRWGFDAWTASLVAVMAGVLAGVINGCLIVFIRLSPIVATLTTLTLYRGLSLGISGGQSYSGYPPAFSTLGTGTVAGIPTQVVVFIAVLAVVVFVMHRTVVGRWVYALGGNPEAARLAGVPVAKVTIGVYATSGALAALAGVIAVARFNTARADFATGAELDAITAAILGGISIAGGRGYILGAAAGALAIAVLRNGLTLVGRSGFIQVVVIGLILLGAVLMDRGLQRLRVRTESRAQLDDQPANQRTVEPAVSGATDK
jgi:ribose/xylose/arabinose/galactoside ABC-type transport system permease subunit